MTTLGGHRSDYQSVLGSIFALEPSTGKVTRANLLGLVRSNMLLFGSIDDDIFGFVIASILRAACGKKTVGLFLRPQACFTGKWLRPSIKRAIFKIMRRSKFISVYTIVPFNIAPEYQRVAKAGLSDPQIWDRTVIPFNPSEEFSRLLCDVARGRRVLAFIGTATWFKGVEQLLDLMAQPSWGDARICVILVGRIPDESAEIAAKLEHLGAKIFPRFISNSELDSVYEVADYIWASYHPDYDQASGNFGRALQAGKIPVVRKGTLIDNIARNLKYPIIPIDFNHINAETLRLFSEGPNATVPPFPWIEGQKSLFIETVRRSL